jgi:PBP1b-binding outer membrane lipoprotein LpoB
MKRTYLAISLATILATVMLLAGCSSVGSTVTETKEFTNFTSVDVQNTFQVEIVQAASFSTTITVHQDLLDYISVSQEGETLKIMLNPHHPFTDFTVGRRTLKAKIAMPAISGLSLSGATKGTISGFKSSQSFRVDVSGASSLNIDDIEVGNTEFDISGASKVTGSLKASDADFVVSGASRVDLKGSANNFTLTASGASILSLLEFTVNTANVKLDGASEATIDVKEKLDTVLSGATKLYFHGNPTMGNISVTGASTIKNK